MIVGRNYSASSQHISHSRASSKKHCPRLLSNAQSIPEQPRRFGWRPASYEDHVADWKRIEERRQSSERTRIEQAQLVLHREEEGQYQDEKAADDVEIHSRPLAIPLRGCRGLRSRAVAHPVRGQQHRNNVARKASTDSSRPFPTHVATLLENTTIPRRKSGPRRRQGGLDRMSSDELIEQWKHIDLKDDSTSQDPVMEVLLSPPDSDGLFPRTSSYDSLAPEICSSSRSSSSGSVPSLDAGDSSILSWSSPQSPRSPRRSGSRSSISKERTLCSTPSVFCLHDHPLLPQPYEEDIALEMPSFNTASVLVPATPSHKQRSKRPSLSSPKSALTISLKALRSAARSFSNFAAPSLNVLPDDHLSRGLFGSQGQHPAFPAEMRPRPVVGVPTAAMRRYLNPSHSTAPGDFHLHGASWDHLDLEAVAARIPIIDENGYVISVAHAPVIKLQTYVRVTPSNAKRKVRSPAPQHRSALGPTSTFTGSMPSNRSQTSPQKQSLLTNNRPRREPRENADFLRVCVLEMSMRRAGKLEAVCIGGVGSGRAKFWLPPRKDVSADGDGSWEGVDFVLVDGRRVPKRWTCAVVD